MMLGLGLGLGFQRSGGGAAMSASFLNGTLDPRITFTRASTGMVTNAAGTLVTEAADVPRFDYDPVTLQPKGLLTEDARTNLLLWSCEFDNAAWVNNAVSITPNSHIAPDGTMSADSLVATTANATHGLTQSVSSDTTQVFSDTVYAKYDSHRWLRLALISGANRCDAWFDLLNGVVGGVANVGTASLSVNSMTPIGGGYYRCRISGKPDTVNTGTISKLFRLSQSDGDVAAYVGDGVSKVIFWEAQLEAAAFASSSIHTTSAPATRAADVVPMTGANFSSWYNASEGTFVAEASVFSTASNRGVFAASDGTALNELFHYTTTSTHNLVTNGGVDQADIVLTGLVTPIVIFKDAFAYKVNDINGATNGTLGVADTSATIPTVNALRLGARGDGTFGLFGHIRRIDYYRTRLPNSELQRLTA